MFSCSKLLPIILGLLLPLMSQAQQEKPLKRYKKKELIAMYEESQRQLTMNEEALKRESTRLDSTRQQLSQTQAEFQSISSQYDSLQHQYWAIEQELDTLSLAFQKLKAEPPKQVEVLDLYSFGYQPYHYQERTYQNRLELMRKEILEFRMENIYDLVRMLQSHRVEEEMKKALFEGFKRVYKGYADGLTQAQLTFFNAKVEETLKRAVRQKTFREVDVMMKENRWIQLLDSK